MSPGREPVSTVVAGRRLRLTNLDKVLYPESATTKAELFSYILAVSEPLLAQLANRPITRRRWPDGVGQPDFYEKAVRPGTPEWIGHVQLRRSGEDYSGYIDHPLLEGHADESAALVWLVQQGTLEFHTPQWRIGRKFGLLGSAGPADRMVLDLDPGAPAGMAECAEVALVAREILAGAGFTSIPVATALPEVVELKMARDRRPGRVFVDVGQNLAARNTITPYSPRGRAHPSVATPLTWAEVQAGDPEPADVRTMPERLARLGDLMAERR